MVTNQMRPNAAMVLSGAASFAASVMLIRNIVNVFIPNEARNFFFSSIRNLSRHFSAEITIIIKEFQANIRNQVFEAAQTYLGSKAMIPSVNRLQVSKTEENKVLEIVVDSDQELVDVYENVRVRWRLVSQYMQKGQNLEETRSYRLTFHKKHKNLILDSYFPYLLERFKAIKDENKVIKLHPVDHINWSSFQVTFNHPMSFDNLAMDPTVKKAVLDDLNNFMNSKEFYSRIGRARKRGYLLYGPPGTGKSSLIAAMANYLNYNIFALDLSGFQSDSDLRSMWLGISTRSIIVVEDIDCTVKLRNRESNPESASYYQNRVTLSGLLNVIDGLWSCLGNERIIIFTTNHKNRLDPALLRPGRMDMHIHMSYCSFSVFKQLAKNYLGIDHHELFEAIEQVMENVEVSPAEVAGRLMKSADADVSLQGLLEFLHRKKSEPSEGEDEDVVDEVSQESKEEVKRRALIGQGRPLIRRERPLIGRGMFLSRGRGRGRPLRR